MDLCSNTPVLAFADYRTPFKIHTAGIGLDLGAVLHQTQGDGYDRVICYTRSLSKSERRYPKQKLEFIALK